MEVERIKTMDFETFREIVRKVKTEKSLLFELQHDKIPTMEDVNIGVQGVQTR